MKKQIIIMMFVSFALSLDIYASLSDGQKAALKNNPGMVIKGMTWNGSAIVPVGSVPVKTDASGGGSASIVSAASKAQMETAVAADPAGALAACQEAINNMGIKPSGTSNSTVKSYINA